MKTFKILTALIALLASTNMTAQDFLSAETPENLFNIGVRVGINTSNRTFGKEYFRRWNVNSWGTGVDSGVVVNLNMRDFFAIQPGFFFESRSGNYSYAQDYIDQEGETKDFTQMGHYRNYNFTIPVMASFRFNLSDNVRWIMEAGPYAQFRIHSSDGDKIQVIQPQTNAFSTVSVVSAQSNPFDFGLKIGSGLSFKNKYSLYVHYLAGGRKAWKAPHAGGHNKAWTVSLGYDF